MKILFIGNCLPFFPSGIVRVAHYFPFLEAEKITWSWLNFNTAFVQSALHWLDASVFGKYRLTDFLFRVFFHLLDVPFKIFQSIKILMIAEKFDILFFQSVLLPAFLMRWIKERNPHVVFDYDDALYVRNERGTRTMVQNSWKVFAGSHALADYARQHNPNVVLLPSCVDLSLYPPRLPVGGREKLRVGWIGSKSTLPQLGLLKAPLEKLAADGAAFEFLVIGAPATPDSLKTTEGITVRYIPAYRDHDLPALASSLDFGVMPLYDTPAEQGKCALKMLIYMAAGLPVISSPVGEATFILRDGINGFFAASVEAWAEKIKTLLSDPKLRSDMGLAGRETVSERYSLDQGFKIMKREIIDPIREGKQKNL